MARPALVAWVLCGVMTATGSLAVGGLAAAEVRDGSLPSPKPAATPSPAVVPVADAASSEQTALPAPSAKQIGGSIGSNDLDAFLSAHTDALKAKDRTAFLAAFDPAKADLVTRQGQVFDDLAKIPFDQATYSVFAATGGESTFRDAHATVDVSFDHQISGVDVHPVEERYRWTVARTGPDGTLAITSVAGYPVTGSTWQKTYNYPAPWDVVPNLTVIVKPHVVLMADGGAASLAHAQAATAEASAEYDLKTWDGGPGGSPGFAVFLTTDRTRLASLYTGSTDARSDEAGVTIGLVGKATKTSYAGARITIDSSADSGYFNNGTVDSPVIFRHEMAHALVMPFDDWSGAYDGTRQDNTWAVEGFAEWTDEGDRSPSDTLSAYALHLWISAHGYPSALPKQDEIYSSDLPTSAAHYQLAQYAFRYMAKTYGTAKTDTFVLAVYKNDSGTAAVDDAMRSVFGTTTAQFTQGWISYVRSVS